MVKKYKTRAAAMDALGQESLQESINGPLATFIGPKWMQWQVDRIVTMQDREMTGVPILSMIGSGQVILIVNCLVRWCDTTGLGWRPSFISAMMLCFNGFSKAMLKGPRPYWLSDKVKTLDPTLETSYGFPSGHSTGMVAIYGVLVWHWGNPYLVGLWAVVSAAVMYSRVYTGAHFIHDVVGGAIMGGLILAADIFNEAYLSVSGVRGSLTEMFVLTLVAAATYLTVLNMAGPEGRVKFIIVYEGVSGAGFCIGLAICHMLDLIVPLPCAEKPPMGFFPVLLGVVGVVALDKLMKRLPEYPDGTRDFWSLTLTMLGFALIMVWTTWLLPYLFLDCPVSGAPRVIKS